LRGGGTRQTITLGKIAVALAIVALSIGGAFVGQQMTRRAELTAIAADANRFIEVTQAFRQKYSALPGDMKNATQFWGVLAGNGNGVACAQAVATGSATCNGDGNGRVAFTRSSNQESLRFWQHLADAGLIAGQYGGTRAQPIAGAQSTSGDNVLWLTGYMGEHKGNISEFGGKWGHVFSVLLKGDKVLPPVEAHEIDAKFDDGMPATGGIIAFKGNGMQRCTAAEIGAAHEASATYNVVDRFRDCPMLYFVRAY